MLLPSRAGHHIYGENYYNHAGRDMLQASNFDMLIEALAWDFATTWGIAVVLVEDEPMNGEFGGGAFKEHYTHARLEETRDLPPEGPANVGGHDSFEDDFDNDWDLADVFADPSAYNHPIYEVLEGGPRPIFHYWQQMRDRVLWQHTSQNHVNEDHCVAWRECQEPVAMNLRTIPFSEYINSDHSVNVFDPATRRDYQKYASLGLGSSAKDGAYMKKYFSLASRDE